MKVNSVKIECSNCSIGVQMCHRRPCWGTVSDFKEIIKAGHAEKLMIDYYNSENINNNERIYILTGANNGNERSKADYNPIGKCSFLTTENKCSIHHIKPAMGAVACCKRENNNVQSENEACVATWATDEGKQLIEEWKTLVNYVEKEDDAGFNFISALSGLLFHGF